MLPQNSTSDVPDGINSDPKELRKKQAPISFAEHIPVMTREQKASSLFVV